MLVVAAQRGARDQSVVPMLDTLEQIMNRVNLHFPHGRRAAMVGKS